MLPVGLSAYATINGNNYNSLDGITDNSGNYTLGVALGTWSVQFFTGNFSDSLDNHGYVDLNSPHYVSIPPTNAVLNMVVYPIGMPFISGPGRFSPTQFGLCRVRTNKIEANPTAFEGINPLHSALFRTRHKTPMRATMCDLRYQ